MAAIGKSAGPKMANRGQASEFVWESSSPSPAEVLELENCFPEVVRISAASLEEASACWKEQAIIARTFQRWVSPDAVIREFRRAGVAGVIQPLSLAHRCHIFRFEDSGTKDLVLSRPWVVNGLPVATEAWRPEFVPAADSVSSALLWVRLPSLPVEFWNEAVLGDILATSGQFVSVDSATRQLSRGGFARACVRVDLRHPLRPGVRIQGTSSPFWQPFQYEYMEGICSCCGSIHLNGPCSPSSPPLPTEPPSARPFFGPWMTATRRRRSPVGVQKQSSKPSGSQPSGSFFDASHSPSSEPLKPNQVNEGWSSPAKVARRRSSKPGISPVSVVADQAPDLVGMKHVPGPEPVCVKGSRGVPVREFRAGSHSTVDSESSKLQTESDILQPPEFQKLKSNNPFALLDAGALEGTSSTRSDANPGPSKRARPVESSSFRTLSKNEKSKGKGIVALARQSKEKIKLTVSPNHGKDSTNPGGRVDKASNEQDEGCVVKGGQSSGAEDVAPEATDQRVDDRSMDCSDQEEEDGSLFSGNCSDSVMSEDQGGPHPSPQL